VYAGFEVTPYYDPLISKLIIWGETRSQAVVRMRRALEEYKIVGVRTNIPFHQTMMDTYPFLTGKYDTRFVEEQFSMLDATENRETYLDIAALMATLVAHSQVEHHAQVYKQPGNNSYWKLSGLETKLTR
jgi:acetyl/propionyl-CoA carboxylase alpha subunit